MKSKYRNMDPQEIRVLLLRAKVSQAAIARDLKVSRSMVRQVIDGTTVSDRVRRGISNAIGMDVARIWPSTYLNGGPKKPGRPFTGTFQPGRAA